MSWDNDHIPTVRIHADNSYPDEMNSIARKLKESGNDDLSKMILEDKARLTNNLPKALEKVGNDEVDGAMKLTRERQYHSKSGYVGHGNLMHSIKKEIKDKGMTVDVAPHALSKDDYEYGQAFEFGLRNKNYPAQHPMRDSGRSLDVNKHIDDMLNATFRN